MALVIGEIKPGFATDPAGQWKPELIHNATMLILPPVWDNNPEIGWGRVFYAFGCDFADIKLRVAIHNVNQGGGWRVETLTIKATDSPVRIDAWAGDDKISICRIPTSATDTQDGAPAAYRVEAVLHG
jgi:hypothetical protein